MRITAIILAAALVPLTPALAEPVDVRIDYSDLDLRNASHVKQLRKRSALAIQRACRGPAKIDWATGADKTCEEDATAAAFKAIEQRRLRYASATFDPAG